MNPLAKVCRLARVYREVSQVRDRARRDLQRAVRAAVQAGASERAVAQSAEGTISNNTVHLWAKGPRKKLADPRTPEVTP